MKCNICQKEIPKHKTRAIYCTKCSNEINHTRAKEQYKIIKKSKTK